MTKEAELTGQRFGSLVVIGRAGKTVARGVLWSLRCDCGGEHTRSTRELRRLEHGACRKCQNARALGRVAGSRRNTRHGESGTPLFRVWTSMRERCNNSNHPAFKWYGGKGVRVCEQWTTYEGFREWAQANGYSHDASLNKADRLSIDRIDPDGNYEPGNCHWIPLRDNCRRQEVSHLLL